MALLAGGTTQDCTTANSGGIKRIYLANVDDVSGFTYASNVATVIAMVMSKVFYEFEFEQDTAEWRESGELVNGSSKYTEELEFYIRLNNDTNRTILDALSNNCGFIAVVEDSNGTHWLLGASEGLGKERPLKLVSDTTTSGKELTDQAGSIIVLGAMSQSKAVTVTQDMSLLL
jgi:hypothetical protein